MASTRMADHIGRVLGDRYRLLAPVGSGGSGHVFVADDVRLRRRVAVKMLHPTLADDEAFLRRFRAEARAAAALNHPNVMSVYDWGEEEDGPFLVCEFLGGGSLRSLLDRGHRLSPSQALLVGLEAARGLDYAHRRGLVHRDIKPANLLFDDDGRLRIGDFGLARALAEAAWTEPVGTVLGTARYASPEQVGGMPVDGKADIYSLALVMVEAVSGRVPFAADTTVATLMGRVDKPMEVPESLGPLASVIARAGRPDPAERLDAAGLGSALQTVAVTMPSPGKLPLAGIAAVDEAAPLDDPTDVGPNSRDSSSRAPEPPKSPHQPQQSRQPEQAQIDEDHLGATGLVAVHGPEPTGPTPVVPSDAALDPTLAQRSGAATKLVNPNHTDTKPAKKPDPQPEVERAAPMRRGRRRRRWPWVFLVVALLAGATGGAYFLVADRAPSFPLPSVVGQTELEAATALREIGFEVELREDFFDGTEAGLVAVQDPPGGGEATLKEGRTVTLFVSMGPPPVAVPDLAGLDEGQAREALAEAGHTVGTVNTSHDEELPLGQLLDWTMKGESPPKGTAIDLVISAGPAPREVPDLIGGSYDDAVARLGELGLEVSRVDEFNADDATTGQVVATSPAAGEQADRGSIVTATVSKGQPTVPDLNGMSIEEARAALGGVGLQLGSTFGPDSGGVFLTLPGAGTKVKPGSSVGIYLI